MRSNTSGRLIAIAFVAPALLLLLAACGSDSASSTASAVAATAFRREQAIAEITAEAAAAPTATRFPSRTSSTPTRAAGSEATVVSSTPTLVPLPTPTSQAEAEQREMDRQALETLLQVSARAFEAGDFESWYETCAPVIRESAIENDSLGRQLRAIGFVPDGSVSIEFILEDVFFSADTAATVVWGLQVASNHFSSFGGGPFLKEDGQWFSMGWGCAG